MVYILKHFDTPLLKFNASADSGNIDSELYKTYKLTEDEIDYIESMIRPMDAEGDGNGKQ